MTRPVRKRGGQIGNQNARKHGFYSAILTPAEASQVSSITDLEGLDPEIALLRVRLQVSLQCDPDNSRVLTEAIRLLANWYSAKYQLDGTDHNSLRTVIARILETTLNRSADTSGADLIGLPPENESAAP